MVKPFGVLDPHHASLDEQPSRVVCILCYLFRDEDRVVAKLIEQLHLPKALKAALRSVAVSYPTMGLIYGAIVLMSYLLGFLITDPTIWGLLATPITVLVLFTLMRSALRALRDRQLSSPIVEGGPAPLFLFPSFPAQLDDTFKRHYNERSELVAWVSSFVGIFSYLASYFWDRVIDYDHSTETLSI